MRRRMTMDRSLVTHESGCGLLSWGALATLPAGGRAVVDEQSGGRRAIPHIGGFEQLEAIGAGGFATVYSAWDTSLHRRVAVKVLLLDTPDHRRFERECRILGELSGIHGIVPVHAATFTRDGRPVIVMALMSGGSLAARLLRHGPMSVGATLAMGYRLGDALDRAHRVKIFHRDIKPANVLFSARDEAALGDFGIALIEDIRASTETVDSLSPPFAPPERFAGAADADPQLGDVYSLGATLYAALTGSPPFGTSAEGGLSGLLRRVANDPIPKIQRSDLPRDLLPVLERAMAKDPSERFPDMASFTGALAQCGSPDPSSVPVITAAPFIPTRELWFAGSEAVPELIESFADQISDPSAGHHDDLGATGLDNDRDGGEAPTSEDREVGSLPPLVGAVRRQRRVPRVVGMAALLTALVAGAYLVGSWGRAPDSVGPRDQPSSTTAPRPTDPPTPPTPTDPPIQGAVLTCTFTGGAALTTPLGPQSIGENSMQLTPGSALDCTDADGESWNGAISLEFDFDHLDQTQGTGSGAGEITWTGGASSSISGTATLALPDLRVGLLVTSGPFRGESADVHFSGWTAHWIDLETISGVAFQPTRIEWGRADA